MSSDNSYCFSFLMFLNLLFCIWFWVSPPFDWWSTLSQPSMLITKDGWQWFLVFLYCLFNFALSLLWAALILIACPAAVYGCVRDCRRDQLRSKVEPERRYPTESNQPKHDQRNRHGEVKRTQIESDRINVESHPSAAYNIIPGQVLDNQPDEEEKKESNDTRLSTGIPFMSGCTSTSRSSSNDDHFVIPSTGDIATSPRSSSADSASLTPMRSTVPSPGIDIILDRSDNLNELDREHQIELIQLQHRGKDAESMHELAQTDETETMSKEKVQTMIRKELEAERKKMEDERKRELLAAEAARELQRAMDQAELIEKEEQIKQLKKHLAESERRIQLEEMTRVLVRDQRPSYSIAIELGESIRTSTSMISATGEINQPDEKEKKETSSGVISDPFLQSQHMTTWLNSPIIQENRYESKLIDIPSNPIGSGIAQSIHPLVNGEAPHPSTVDRFSLSPRSAPSLASRSALSNLSVAKESVPSSAIAIALSTIEPSTSSSSKPSQAQQYAKNVTDNEMQEQAKLDIHSVDEINEHN